MQVDLKGKVAIVTGAGLVGDGKQGLGSGSAITLAKNGAAVSVWDIVEANAQATVDAINKEGGNAQALKVDVASAEEVQAATAKVLEKFGRIDILFANAGITEKGCPVMLWDLDDKIFDAVVKVNFYGVFNCFKAVIPTMIEQRSGRLIATSSMVFRAAFPGLSTYSATKAGVSCLVNGLALELGEYNITVNAVAPGIIYTSIWDELAKTFAKMQGSPDHMATFEGFCQTIPLKRPQTPQDIANAVAFLASDAASEITGQTLPVCGGKTPF